MTLCRAFMNRQIEEAYQILFERVFFLMQDFIDKSVQWQHIHDQEFYDIVMNMNQNQINDELIHYQRFNNSLLIY